ISCERGDTLFSVQPVPPSQGDAKLAALRGATQRGGAALAVALVLLALVAPAGRWRWLVVLAAAWCAARAPLGSSLRTAELFSPAAFYRPALGVFSASAGSLIAAGVVALCAASALWRRGLARRWWVASASPSGTLRDWVAHPTPAPCRCSSAWEPRRPRRRLAPLENCTPGGSTRRLPLTITRRVLRCGRAPASPRRRSAWRA